MRKTNGLGVLATLYFTTDGNELKYLLFRVIPNVLKSRLRGFYRVGLEPEPEQELEFLVSANMA